MIDKIELNSMTIAKQNNQNEYFTVPVWDFFGSEIITYSDEYKDYANKNGGYKLNENNRRIVGNSDISYLTINAIDGSIINCSLGK